jgi:transcriptional regulator with XRE-family HTH domain
MHCEYTHMAAKENFAQRLKRLLSDRGFSQTEFAARARIERSELNRLVNDKRGPKPYEIGWLAEALGTTKEELLDGIDVEKLDLFEEEVERGQGHAREVLTAERERDEAKAALRALEDRVHTMEEGWRSERRELQAALAEQRSDCAARIALREEAFAGREQELLNQVASLRDQTTSLERELHQARIVAADRERQAQQLQREVEAARGQAAGTALVAGLIGAAIGSSGKGR